MLYTITFTRAELTTAVNSLYLQTESVVTARQTANKEDVDILTKKLTKLLVLIERINTRLHP